MQNLKDPEIRKLKDPESCFSFFFFLTSILALTKKAWDKKEVGTIEPQLCIIQLNLLYKSFTQYIHICAGKKKKE